MNLRDVVAKNLVRRLIRGEDPQLHGLSAPVVDAVARRALDQLERIIPCNEHLDRVLNGEWDACEACSQFYPQEELTLVDTEDGIRFCPSCLADEKGKDE